MLRRFVLVLALMVAAFPAIAADHVTTPLMVIRFNQPRVYYEQPLYNAFNRAIQTKADVQFNVINYYPPQPALKRTADINFQRVLATIQRMGVPKNRLTLRNEAAPDLSYSEVHIYVR